MPNHLSIVAGSVAEVFGLVAVSWVYCRRFRPDMSGVLRLTMHLFIPCLAFTAILDHFPATIGIVVAGRYRSRRFRG